MNRIAEILLDWYAREGRDLPWRRTRDPYRIWLSEVILQQTRVAQGMEYYLRFTERFPDVASLAAAPEDEVLKLWQGLYEFPLIETDAPVEFPDLAALPQFRRLLGDGPWHLVRSVSLPRHQLSHQRLHAVVHRIETPAFTPAAAAMAVPADSLGDYAVPRLVDRYLMQAGSDDSSF